MTFTEIVDNIADALNQTSDEAIERIGKSVNRRYRRITSTLGLLPSRRAIQSVAFDLGDRRLVVSNCEKVISVQDLESSDPQPITLTEVTYAEMLEIVPRTDRPTMYAVESITSHETVLLTDFNPQEAFTVSVECEARATTLSGVLEPVFNESYHDILEFGAKADELRKKEKIALARDAENDFERRLSELRLHLAVSGHQDIVQGKQRSAPITGGGGGGSSAASGGSSYTQTGLITFDRDPLAPFAVTAGSAVVPNLDADKLDGLDSTALPYLPIAGGTLLGDLKFTDASFDIGKSGATRPRDLFLSRNAVIGGTLGVTGVTTLGTLAAGAATFSSTLGVTGVATLTAQALLNGGALLGGHLLFTDATFDIGASGATRPRDLFMSRNAVIGGTLGVTGVATLTAQAVLTAAFKTGPANAYINDDANAQMTTGLTINQGAEDNEILALKSSDIAHGITDSAETDTFGSFKKGSGPTGGMRIDGYSEGTSGLELRGFHTTDVTTKTTGSSGAVEMRGHLKSGTGTTDLGANANILAVINHGTTRFILDADGDSHQDVGTAWTNFDSHDDILVLDSLALEVSRDDDPWKEVIRQNMADSLDALMPRQAMQDMKLVSFNDDGHHFVNMSKLTMLHTGAIRQLARANKQLRSELHDLRRLLPNAGGPGSGHLQIEAGE